MRIKIKKKVERLIEGSFVKATRDRKLCPCFRIDEIGCYCAKNLKRGDEVTDERREVCDYASRMARCLDTEKYRMCMFYTGEEVLE